MAIRRQHIGSQLRVLQEAVASAVHELSQPLNVVNLLADNILEDVALLESGRTDESVVAALRRRVEAIVEQSGKASDITRWIRSYAVGIETEVSPFDPHALLQRLIGIFANDLRVAGVNLTASAAPDDRMVESNEPLVNFAFTEAILWLGGFQNAAQPADTLEDGRAKRIEISFPGGDVRSFEIVVARTIDEPMQAVDSNAEQAPAGIHGKPPLLPLLGLVGRMPGHSLGLSLTPNGDVTIRLTLPRAGSQI